MPDQGMNFSIQTSKTNESVAKPPDVSSLQPPPLLRSNQLLSHPVKARAAFDSEGSRLPPPTNGARAEPAEAFNPLF